MYDIYIYIYIYIIHRFLCSQCFRPALSRHHVYTCEHVYIEIRHENAPMQIYTRKITAVLRFLSLIMQHQHLCMNAHVCIHKGLASTCCPRHSEKHLHKHTVWKRQKFLHGQISLNSRKYAGDAAHHEQPDIKTRTTQNLRRIVQTLSLSHKR
jgi:hypothetical protein